MITKDMTLMQVLQLYPKTSEVFKKYGMMCMECMGASEETIENGAKMHGIDLLKLINELQQVV